MRRTDRRGMTIIEIMVVVVILGLLATVIITSVMDRLAAAKVGVAKTDITQLHNAVQQFNLDQGRVPVNLTELVARPANVKTWPPGGYLGDLRVVPPDPWDNPYLYRTPGPDGRPYIIESYGADGTPGGEDYDADLDCWKILERKQ